MKAFWQSALFYALGALSCLFVRGHDAHSQSSSYPKRSILLVVPISAGGAVDVLARLRLCAWATTWAKPSWSRTAPGLVEISELPRSVGQRRTATRCSLSAAHSSSISWHLIHHPMIFSITMSQSPWWSNHHRSSGSARSSQRTT